jgi:Flp pilus assembly protein TadD
MMPVLDFDTLAARPRSSDSVTHARLLALIHAGSWQDAEPLLRALASAGSDGEVPRELAIACTRARRHALALELLDRARELAPMSAAVATNRGSVLRQLGRIDEARASFEHAAALDPGLAAPCYNLGKMLAAQAQLLDARGPLREAVRREPAHVGAWIKLAEVEKESGPGHPSNRDREAASQRLMAVPDWPPSPLFAQLGTDIAWRLLGCGLRPAGWWLGLCGLCRERAQLATVPSIPAALPDAAVASCARSCTSPHPHPL